MAASADHPPDDGAGDLPEGADPADDHDVPDDLDAYLDEEVDDAAAEGWPSRPPKEHRPLRLLFPAEVQDNELAEAYWARVGGDSTLRFLGTFGTALRAMRAEVGFSQRDLARAAGVSQRWLHRVENGAGTSWATALRLVAAAGCRVVIETPGGEALLPNRYEGVVDRAGRSFPPHRNPRAVTGPFGTAERRRPGATLPVERRPRWTYDAGPREDGPSA